MEVFTGLPCIAIVSKNALDFSVFVGASASTMLSSAKFICLRVAISRSSGTNCALAAPEKKLLQTPAYASQHSLGLILTEEALYSTEIATETSQIQPEIDAEKRILQRNFPSHLNSWTKYIMGWTSIEQIVQLTDIISVQDR